ncbi:putative E3 ubiquitin-protein ligase HERC1 [Symbiodinium microadriaticum]|uniref:Putative E3 ubiquitin-protein ligase HERC1 n=1 Tax=Symbiodinium microadriaticum TaxID=2951 RepID=A0A1Q9EHB5_SYMMI|nr:putative E3 ubiquitin-protein ligase HERC1 [Symbiodinium microadriaticum]
MMALMAAIMITVTNATVTTMVSAVFGAREFGLQLSRTLNASSNQAVLQQQLMRERGAREAAEGGLKGEIDELKERLALEVHRLRQDLGRSTGEVAASLQSQVQAVQAGQTEALEQKVATLKEALQAQLEARQREADESGLPGVEGNHHVGQRRYNGKQAEMRSLDLWLHSSGRMQLQQRLASCLKPQAEGSGAEAKSDLQQAEQRLKALLATAQNSVAEATAKLQAETAARASEVERLEGALRGQRSEIDAQIVSLQSANLERQDSVKELGPAMKALVSEALPGLTSRVDAEIAERRQTDERTGGKLETLQEALGREQRAREAAMSENGRAVGTLATRLDGQEKALPELDAAIRAEVSKLEDSMASFRQEERSAREVATADLSGAQARKHEAMTEEIRREHAAHKEEKLSFDELNRRCQEVSTLSAQQMRAELAVEVKRLDQALPGLEEKFKVLLGQERCYHEHQAQVAAQEVKAALEAHGELAEALESEQRLVVQRLTEGAAVCWGDPEFGPDQKKAQHQLVDGIVHICPSAAAFAALKNTGSVVTFGHPSWGGDSRPVRDQLACGVVKIAATDSAFAAVKEDGSVVVWGNPNCGGDASSVMHKLLRNVEHIWGNERAFVAIKKDGSIVTWGDREAGGDSSSVQEDFSEIGAARVVKVFSNECAFAALRADGSVITWGDPDGGGDSSNVSEFLEAGVKDICSTDDAFAALRDNGQVVTWGDDASGGGSSAVRQQLRSGVKQLCSTRGSMAALKEDGTVVCWGNPQSGGNSTSVAGLRAVKELCATRAAFAALKEDGSVHAWGDEKHGADTTATESILSSGVTKLFGNNVSFAAIKSNGGIVSWGDPARGPPLVHPRVPDAQGIYGTKFAFALLCQDGDVITWGDPSCGGDSSAIDAQLKEHATAVQLQLMPVAPPAAKTYPGLQRESTARIDVQKAPGRQLPVERTWIVRHLNPLREQRDRSCDVEDLAGHLELVREPLPLSSGMRGQPVHCINPATGTDSSVKHVKQVVREEKARRERRARGEEQEEEENPEASAVPEDALPEAQRDVPEAQASPARKQSLLEQLLQQQVLNESSLRRFLPQQTLCPTTALRDLIFGRTAAPLLRSGRLLLGATAPVVAACTWLLEGQGGVPGEFPENCLYCG